MLEILYWPFDANAFQIYILVHGTLLSTCHVCSYNLFVVWFVNHIIVNFVQFPSITKFALVLKPH